MRRCRDFFTDAAAPTSTLGSSCSRRGHGVLNNIQIDPQQVLDNGSGQRHKTFGDDVRGRNPHLLFVTTSGGQAGFDIIVCATGESAGRAGEAAAVSLLCYPQGEFARVRERVQAGGDTPRETGVGCDRVRASVGGGVMGEFAVGGPHFGCGPREGWVEEVRGSCEVVPA